MENKHSKLLTATLSKCYADKDKSLAIIESIIKEGAGVKGENIESLKLQFEKIATLELAITIILTYFSNNLSTPEEQNINFKNNDDNNS